MDRCEICKFWIPKIDKVGHGSCQRHAPLVTGGLHSEVETVWPITHLDDWCGDFISDATKD